MTTERFTIDKKGGVFYLFDNGNLISIFDGQPICDLLNTLHEENQELKRLVKVTVKDYTDLEQSFDLIDKENKQLKKQLDAFKPIIFEDVNGGSSVLYEKVEE